MKKKLCIIGNSVTLRVRPKVDNESDKVYSSLLQKELDDGWEVIKFGKSRYLSTELHAEAVYFLDQNADVYLLNIGCVDAPPREIPLWYSDIIFERKKTRLISVFHFFYKILKKSNLRSSLVNYRNRSPWVDIDEFKNSIEQSILLLTSKRNTKVIIIGINKGNERLEKHLPGILKNYKDYNDALKKISLNNNQIFIDLDDLNDKDHFPDGVHYSEIGHKIVSKRILKVLNDY